MPPFRPRPLHHVQQGRPRHPRDYRFAELRDCPACGERETRAPVCHRCASAHHTADDAA